MPSNFLSEVDLGTRALKSNPITISTLEFEKERSIGMSVAVSKRKGKYLVSSSDPITGTSIRMGWHAVNVSANDVATSGVIPDTLNVTSLFPLGMSTSQMEKLFVEISKTASGLGITVAGAQTEIISGLRRPIVVVTAFGSGDDFVTSSNSRKYDFILMTKTAGIEGTSILSHLSEIDELGSKIRRRGLNLIKKISVIEEAQIAFNTRKIHAMHDVTEGGIIGAVYEMSVASHLGFEIYSDSVPIDSSTNSICSRLHIDPLRLIGSGSLLISCPPKSSRTVMKALRSKNIRCTKIGRFLPDSKERWICTSDKRKRVRQTSIQDEVWATLGKYGKLP